MMAKLLTLLCPDNTFGDVENGRNDFIGEARRARKLRVTADTDIIVLIGPKRDRLNDSGHWRTEVVSSSFGGDLQYGALTIDRRRSGASMTTSRDEQGIELF